MKRWWKLLIVVGLIIQTPVHSKSKKNGTLLGQLSPLKRAALLPYPEFPAAIKDRISGRKAAAVSVHETSTKDWGLATIGFFQVFGPLLRPISSETRPCSAAVTVAVIDTGIDYTHPELQSSIWINRGESGPWSPLPALSKYNLCRNKSCNGIDDDDNGFIDDVAGWDFVNDVPLPYDTHGHGSHIAGIIAGAGVGESGRPGVCPGVSIMALKYYDSLGVGYNNLQNTVRAFRYAVKMGVQIVNYSGGGTDPAPAERLAIEEARTRGVLVVAAAGNEGQNNDVAPYFPASYGLDNIISVASLSPDSQLLPSSNWGPGRVHVAAPGQSVLSCLPGGKLGIMTGTSQATAFVTGTAALLASQLTSLKTFDYRQIKHWITNGARPLPSNNQKQLLIGGILSVNGALALQQSELDSTQLVAPIIAWRPVGKSIKPVKAQ